MVNKMCTFPQAARAVVIIAAVLTLASCADEAILPPLATVTVRSFISEGQTLVCTEKTFEIGLPIADRVSVLTYIRRSIECSLKSPGGQP
jgi:hypothetical protein